MPTPAEQPRFDQPVVDQGGRVTQAWANYFLRMASAQSNDDLRALYEALAARVAELEEGQSLNFSIFGANSVNVDGSAQPGGVVLISLVGDMDAPGNTMYYGTGPTGSKGWFPVSDTSLVATGELTKSVGLDGVTTFGLADLPDSGVGVGLVKITRDAKGRVSGTQSATTDDLPAGSTNKYFPEAPNDGQLYGRKSGAWEVVPAGGGGVTSVNARTGVVAVPDFVQKATAPTSTDFGRPIIDGDRWFNTTNGVDYTWVAGAWTYDNAAALSRYMPAYLANGTASPIPLNADGTVPAYLADGSYSPFATQA